MNFLNLYWINSGLLLLVIALSIPFIFFVWLRKSLNIKKSFEENSKPNYKSMAENRKSALSICKKHLTIGNKKYTLSNKFVIFEYDFDKQTFICTNAQNPKQTNIIEFGKESHDYATYTKINEIFDGICYLFNDFDGVDIDYDNLNVMLMAYSADEKGIIAQQKQPKIIDDKINNEKTNDNRIADDRIIDF